MFLISTFDLFVEEKYAGYWYFEKGIDWKNIVAYVLLIPPVNVIIVNCYPYFSSWLKKLSYLVLWILFIGVYEQIALLPEPWGFFHYGWWKFRYSLILDPFLLWFLFLYYKWIVTLEK